MGDTCILLGLWKSNMSRPAFCQRHLVRKEERYKEDSHEEPPGGNPQRPRDSGRRTVAAVLEVSRQTIGSLENGRYNPSILLAFKIARYFGMAIEDIFIYEEEQP